MARRPVQDAPLKGVGRPVHGRDRTPQRRKRYLGCAEARRRYESEALYSAGMSSTSL